MSTLKEIVKDAIKEATSPNEVLRAMLVPSSLGRVTIESWFVIAANPLSWQRVSNRGGGYEELRRTSSDYVGVRGILQSFGLLFGFDALPDVINPEDFRNDVIKKPMNIYCIASPKANHWTKALLDEFGEKWRPLIEFRADEASRNLRNVRVSIFDGIHQICPRNWDFKAPGDRYARDFGIIVRGPNPFHEDHMVTIIAGRSSLGTEAACAAFTDPKKIDVISRWLNGLEEKIDLENHKQPFWVLASMERNLGDKKEEAKKGSLRIEQVEPFVRI